MRSKACDALCTSHVYHYNGKVSKNIQNSVKKSLQVLLFLSFRRYAGRELFYLG
jgi:hypothetical protein